MTETEVVLFGGPADGEHRVVECDLSGEPPSDVRIFLSPSLQDALDAHSADELLTIRSVVYRREVNPADDGPLWRYVVKSP